MAPSKKSNDSTTAVASVHSKVDKIGTTLEKKAPPKIENSVLKYTPIKDIPKGVEKVRAGFQTRKTHPLQYRLNQLRSLYFALKDNVDAICDALEKDFYRSPTETRLLEVYGTLNEIIHTMSNLHKWARKEPVTGLPINLQTNPVYVEKIPLGVVLVISPFNYPLFLSVSAVMGAISAGNTVVFKPSESTPYFSKLLCELFEQAFDDDIYLSVNGAVTETTALLEEKFDKIMYTGNNFVGKIIAKKAAETLTPVILELGGKSPAFVLDDVKEKDIPTIAKRIVWGRFVNAGQTCIAVDYVLVASKHKVRFQEEVIKAIEELFYKGLTKESTDYTHIIHQRAYENLKKLIKTSKGKLLTGANFDDETRFISPTVFGDIDWTDSTMQQEIFGPILPIILYDDLSEAINGVTTNHDTPLALYVFTSGAQNRKKNPQIDLILTCIRSGGLIVNDVLLHAALADAPFGGVGNSGYGAYHGLSSFKAFSHERTTIEQKLWNEFLLQTRYPPYTESNESVVEGATIPYNDKIWFKRTGDVSVSGPSVLFEVYNSVAAALKLGYRFIASS